MENVFETLRRTLAEAAPDALPALLGRLEEERLRGENRLTALAVNGSGRAIGPALDAQDESLAVQDVALRLGVSEARPGALQARFMVSSDREDKPGNRGPDTWLKPEDAAAIAGVSVERIYSWAKSQRWASRPTRRCLRIAEPGFRHWLASRTR